MGAERSHLPAHTFELLDKRSDFLKHALLLRQDSGLSGLILGRTELSSVPLSLANSRLSEVVIKRLAASAFRFSVLISSATSRCCSAWAKLKKASIHQALFGPVAQAGTNHPAHFFNQ